MEKQIKQPQQTQESKKTFPLDEANRMKQQKHEVAGVGERPKDETKNGHTRTP